MSEKPKTKKSKKQKKKRGILFRVIRDLIIIGFITGCIILLSIFWIEGSVSQYVYLDADKIPYNEYALVLGTSKTLGGVENVYFTDRMKAAALLYKKGKVKYIIVSGPYRENPLYDNPSDMLNALTARGVPASRILKDKYSYRTLDSIFRTRDAFLLKKFTVISQYSHITRALYIAKYRDLDVVAFASDDGKKHYFTLKDRIREYLAKIKMMLDLYILRTQAKVPLDR